MAWRQNNVTTQKFSVHKMQQKAFSHKYTQDVRNGKRKWNQVGGYGWIVWKKEVIANVRWGERERETDRNRCAERNLHFKLKTFAYLFGNRSQNGWRVWALALVHIVSNCVWDDHENKIDLKIIHIIFDLYFKNHLASGCAFVTKDSYHICFVKR